MSIHNAKRSQASNDRAIGPSPPSPALSAPCQNTTIAPPIRKTANFAMKFHTVRCAANGSLTFCITKASVAAINAVGTMLGRSPHSASCTDQPSVISIHASSPSEIQSLIGKPVTNTRRVTRRRHNRRVRSDRGERPIKVPSPAVAVVTVVVFATRKMLRLSSFGFRVVDSDDAPTTSTSRRRFQVVMQDCARRRSKEQKS